MYDLTHTPQMTPRELGDRSGWYVEVRWTDGPEEHIGPFASKADAQRWINHAPLDWLPQHPKRHHG